jgi:aspartate/methionine/tyrosine aminotransferase
MFDFGFGDSPGIRSLLKSIRGSGRVELEISDLYYQHKTGNALLVTHLKTLISRFAGKCYDHVFVTAGAEHAINTLLRALRPTLTKIKNTNLTAISFESPYFSHYADMAERAGYFRISGSLPGLDYIRLIDSPSNPEGKIRADDGSASTMAKYVIWDGVYHNDIYCKNLYFKPAHDFYVGSIGKMLGIPGIRLGWIAFDNTVNKITKKPADIAIAHEIYSETLGVSGASQIAAIKIISETNMDCFFKNAASTVDSNRELMTGLEYLSGTKVPDNGMFFYMQTDSSIRELFDRVGVTYIPGEQIGSTEDFIRLNLAQTNDLTKKMVMAIRSADRKC